MRFFRLFGKGEAGEERLHGVSALQELGLNVITGLQLDSRLEVISEFLELLKSDKFNECPIERVNLMCKVIEKAVIPYGRGRESPYFTKLIDAWGRLVQWYNARYRILESDDLDPEKRKKLLYILDAIAKEEMYSAFLIVLTVSFSEKDLAKNVVAVIQTIVQSGVTPLGGLESLSTQGIDLGGE